MPEDAFDKREEGYEAKYKLDEELRFKAESRRNKLLGLWAAERMGMTDAEAEAYAKEVVHADFQAPGTAAMIAKVIKDLEERGVEATAEEIEAEMQHLYAVAVEQIAKDYPAALDRDHRRVGD